MKRFLPVSLLFSAVFAVFFSASCVKDKDKHKLTIVVVAENRDGDLVPAQNADLHVFAPVANSFIDYYASTNNDGEVSFEFENKVIVEIVSTKGSFRGCNFAEVNEGENTVTVELKPFGAKDNGC